MTTAQQIKAWAESHWNDKGVLNANHGNVFTMENGHTRVRAGTARNPQPDKETKRRRAGLAMYNEKLKPIILAEANKRDASYMVIGDNKYAGPIYTWPKTEAPAKAEPVAGIPRKRVPKAKLEHAARIIAKVPEDKLVEFLAHFGLSLSLAASIASLDNAEMIARQFLRATL